jgi:hypothetical protein
MPVMVPRNFTQEIRPDNHHEGAFYDECALAFPLFGDPRSYCEDICIPSRYTARIDGGSATRD